MVRLLPTKITLLAVASANLLSAAADNSIDVDVLSQSASLRGAVPDDSMHRSLLSVIETDELEEESVVSDLVLEPDQVADEYDRELELVTCSSDEKIFKVDLNTSSNGSGTKWRLFRYDALKTPQWSRVAFGPEGFTYGNNAQYIQKTCVDPATYAFVMLDQSGQSPQDYSCYFKGSKIFGKESGFSERKVHYFSYTADVSSFAGGSSSSSSSSSNASAPPPTRRPSPKPTPLPTRQPSPKPTPRPINPAIGGRLADCSSNERLFTINILADEYGKEISWKLKKEGTTLLSNDRTYNNFETDTVEACIPEGAYTLTMNDEWGDGILDPGYYKVYIDGVLTYEGGKNYKTREHSFNFQAQDMTERDQNWLDSHNIRRQQWHTDYGKTYVPLKWSNSLKVSSQVWAEELLKTCGTRLYHDSQNAYGENLASNFGTGSWAQVKSTEAILKRFVEDEKDWEWPRCAHLTQVLWRGSEYVGCAEMAKDTENGGKCHVQVCRYARAGNCNMNSFNDHMEGVMRDSSNCGEECPPGGCPV